MLVLSLFPGADLFGMAFEAEGFCVVRGPDIMLGGDIRNWHVPSGYFDGVIGGPPCKMFSDAVIGHKATQGNLIPEFERIVKEAAPKKFWVMENVKRAPQPEIDSRYSFVFDAWEVGAKQHRKRRFTSNLCLEIHLEKLLTSLRDKDPWPTVTATEYKYVGNQIDARRAGKKVGRTMTLAEVKDAMGLPPEFDTPMLLKSYKYQVLGNGVPVQMGRAVAKAVKKALEEHE